MYDNIKTILYINTLQNFDNEVFTKIKERFSMDSGNRSIGTFNNTGNETRFGNNGIHIRYTPTTHNSPAHFEIRFSLHKFYNSLNGKGLQNYDKFSFADAKNAFSYAVDFFSEASPVLDITKAEIKAYEIGLNMELSEPPQPYMNELSHIQTGQRDISIIETNKLPPKKHTATHSYSKIRAVYCMYDKTSEVLSKNKGANVPNNLLRIEKKYNRQSETRKSVIYFDDKDKNGLFNQEFINAAFYDFADSFTKNLRFKEKIIKSKNMTSHDLIVHELIREFGNVKVYTEIYKDYKAGVYDKNNYCRLKAKITTFLSTNFEVKTVENEKTKYFKSMLLQKIKEFKP